MHQVSGISETLQILTAHYSAVAINGGITLHVHSSMRRSICYSLLNHAYSLVCTLHLHCLPTNFFK